MLIKLDAGELEAELSGRKITSVSIIDGVSVYLQLDGEYFLEVTPEIEYSYTPILEVEYGKEDE